jgi:hypothetical protein
MATVAPSAMSATACSGDATILFMAVLTCLRVGWSGEISGPRGGG